MAKEVKNKNENKKFYKDFKAELKKVIWPTPKKVFNNTVAVLTIVLVVTVIVFVLDLIFDALNTYGVAKLIPVKNEISNEQIVDSSSDDINTTDVEENTLTTNE